MEQLTVVSFGKQLVEECYFISKKLPKEENYIIKPQLLRAAISIPSNIIEGQQRTDKEFYNFLRVARGSLYEVKVQLEIITKVYKIDVSKALELCDSIGAMSYKLMIKLKTAAES